MMTTARPRRVLAEEIGNVVSVAFPTPVLAKHVRDEQFYHEVREDLIGLVENQGVHKMFLDLHNVECLDDGTWGVIVGLAKRLMAKGSKLVICSLSEAVNEEFNTLCISRLITVVEDRDAAVKAVKALK